MKKLLMGSLALLLLTGCVREPRRQAPVDTRPEAPAHEGGAGEAEPTPVGGWKYEARLQRADPSGIEAIETPHRIDTVLHSCTS
jgi:hypothetical protein